VPHICMTAVIAALDQAGLIALCEYLAATR
jgi:hypothetical protein